jgi:hypothetical protein
MCISSNAFSSLNGYFAKGKKALSIIKYSLKHTIQVLNLSIHELDHHSGVKMFQSYKRCPAGAMLGMFTASPPHFLA